MNLNHVQKEFVNNVINSRQNWFLIGPPGTGKSTTLLELINQFHQSKCKHLQNVNNQWCINANILLMAFNVKITAEWKTKINQIVNKGCQTPKIKTIHAYFNTYNSLTNVWFKDRIYENGWRDDVSNWLNQHQDQISVKNFKNLLDQFHSQHQQSESSDFARKIQSISADLIKDLILILKKLALANLDDFKKLVISNTDKKLNFKKWYLVVIDEVQDLQPFMYYIIGFLQWINNLQWFKGPYKQLQLVCAGDHYQLLYSSFGANANLLDEFLNHNQFQTLQLKDSYRLNNHAANNLNVLKPHQSSIVGLNLHQYQPKWFIFSKPYKERLTDHNYDLSSFYKTKNGESLLRFDRKGYQTLISDEKKKGGLHFY